MATVTLLVCDGCGGRDKVATAKVAHPAFPAWEIDLCESCYGKQLAMRRFAGARSAARRKRATMRETRVALPEQPGVTQRAG